MHLLRSKNHNTFTTVNHGKCGVTFTVLSSFILNQELNLLVAIFIIFFKIYFQISLAFFSFKSVIYELSSYYKYRIVKKKIRRSYFFFISSSFNKYNELSKNSETLAFFFFNDSYSASSPIFLYFCYFMMTVLYTMSLKAILVI